MRLELREPKSFELHDAFPFPSDMWSGAGAKALSACLTALEAWLMLASDLFLLSGLLAICHRWTERASFNMQQLKFCTENVCVARHRCDIS